MEIDGISRPEVVLAALEHVIDGIGVNGKGQLISSFDVIHVERIYQTFQNDGLGRIVRKFLLG
jgi:hypothetical protein